MDAEVALDKIPAIRRSLADLIGEKVREAAFEIEKRAKENTPVDTGALRNSIHVVTDRDDSYAEAAASAQAAHESALAQGRTPKGRPASGELRLFPEPPKPKAAEAIVAVGVEYGIDVERGTVRQSPQPFLTPAVEQVRPLFKNAVASAVREAVR